MHMSLNKGITDWQGRRVWLVGASTGIGLACAQALRTALAAAGVLLRTDLDLLDRIWPERPALPAQPVYEHHAPHAALPQLSRWLYW